MIAATLATGAALALPGPAAAEEGVFVDPNGPAGKEYALPLERARQEAIGKDLTPSSSNGSSPLFGAGIRKAVTGTRGARSGSGKSAVTRPRPTPDAPASAERARLVRAASDPGSGIGWSFALGLGVILAGGVLGGAIRGLGRRGA